MGLNQTGQGQCLIVECFCKNLFEALDSVASKSLTMFDVLPQVWCLIHSVSFLISPYQYSDSLSGTKLKNTAEHRRKKITICPALPGNAATCDGP